MNQPETFPAKRLLTPVRYRETEFFAADYNMNLYRGCNHSCIYCDTRSECYRIDRFDSVRHKENAMAMLENELRSKKSAGIVTMGAASDSYNALEESLCLTRQALQKLKRYQFGVGITTKGMLVARDAELLAELGRVAPTYVTFSITTADDALAALIEPSAPRSSARFAAMRTLSSAGVYTGLWLNPVLPFLTDNEDNLHALLTRTAESGGRYAVCHFGMTLRTGNREHFFAALDKDPHFQGVKQKYVKAFALDYGCPSPDAERLSLFFQAECKRLSLLYRFEDINRALRERYPVQQSFV